MTLEYTQTSTAGMTRRETIYLGISFILLGVGIGLHSLNYLDLWWSLAIASLPGGFLMGITTSPKPWKRRAGMFFCSLLFLFLAGIGIRFFLALGEQIIAGISLAVGATMIIAMVEELLKMEEGSGH